MRKNRGTRTRDKGGLTQRHDDGRLESLPTGERVSGRGDLTRHRTVMVSDDAGEPTRVLDSPDCFPGRVEQAVGAQGCVVRLPDDRRLECTVRRLIRTLAQQSRTAVVAGDRVIVRALDARTGVIEWVEPRATVLSRTSNRKEHIIVANVAQAVIVASASDPPLKPNLIDRFIATCERSGLTPLICINKVDLVDLSSLQPVAGRYEALGYAVYLTSVTRGWGLEPLRRALVGRDSVLSGQSGVGKSSLLNAVDQQLDLKIGDVGGDIGKGRHTTRTARMLPLTAGGYVVDTPGIRQLELWDIDPSAVEAYFIEFRPFVRDCRFKNCHHVDEAGCGVRLAADMGLIAAERYDSYLKLIAPERFFVRGHGQR